MPQYIEVNKFGAPDVLELKQKNITSPGNEEVVIRHTSIGINYNDILSRKGLFRNKLPFIPGNEACGVIEEVGKDVEGFQVGDRVAYVTAPSGAYSEGRIINFKYLVNIPDYLENDDVAACLLKGMAAHYLMRRTFFVRKNNTILIHAAAGGTGLLMCMMAKQYGARIIASVGSEGKMPIVKEVGADLVLNYNDNEFVAKILDYTEGQGVDVAYDSIGKTTMQKTKQVVSEFGLLVCSGFTSGIPDPIDFLTLYNNSSFVTCPNFMHYKQDKMELILSANEIFAQLQKKLIKPYLYRKYHLNEVQEAHRNLENKKQIGQSIIII